MVFPAKWLLAAFMTYLAFAFVAWDLSLITLEENGNDPANVDARGMWNRLKCSPMMFWLAECSGVPEELLDQAEDAAKVAASINPKDGNPHGKLMRTALPWDVVAGAMLLKAPPSESGAAEARRAFDRLTDKNPSYRHLREWLV